MTWMLVVTILAADGPGTADRTQYIGQYDHAQCMEHLRQATSVPGIDVKASCEPYDADKVKR